MNSEKPAALELTKLCCRVMDEKKAGDLVVLDVSQQSSITDFLVIATATSQPHLRALRVELEKALDGAGVRLVGMDSSQESGWMVIDAFDVMIHLFLADVRERYGLERLWRDAAEISVDKLINNKPVAKTKRTAGSKKSAAGTKRTRTRK